jgi:hypothetical protein
MTKSFDPSIPFPGADEARTRRQLRLIKALFRIDDPELEQALAVVVERLAAAGEQERAAAPPKEIPRIEPSQE